MTDLDHVFSALGDGTRRAILARVALGETKLSDIAEPFEMSQTAVSKHVRVLESAGLVRVHKRGRTRYCRLEAAPMEDAVSWLSAYREFWENQLESLGRHLEKDK